MESILFNEQLQRVNGVRLKNGVVLNCARGVISATGYHNTMNNLVPREVRLKAYYSYYLVWICI